MSEKRRLSVSVDAELVEAGRMAVAAGQAGSMSAWVNAALRERSENDRRLRLMGEWIADYEAEHGVITEEEMEEVHREMRARAIVVRDGKVYRPASA